MDKVSYYIITGIIWGVICEGIGSSKGIKNGFWWGFFLGLIGLIVMLCSKSKNNY